MVDKDKKESMIDKSESLIKGSLDEPVIDTLVSLIGSNSISRREI